VTFEYVMLAGVNDSDADADEMARLVAAVPCMINLIPFNAWPGMQCARVSRFAHTAHLFLLVVEYLS
jgi:23S rRNA (adenine2503-C2)-methyltransferase